MTDKAFEQITGRTSEQNAAREAIRDKVEALRVRVLAELGLIAAEAEGLDCLRDTSLDEFACYPNRVSEAVNPNVVDRAFADILSPIQQWRPR